MRIAFALVVGTTALAAAAPRGKIVRVERPGMRMGVPKLCIHQRGSARSKDVCFGSSAPERGDILAVVDDTRKLGDSRVETVAPLDGCPYGWAVTYDNDIVTEQFSGVIGAGVSSRGHRVTDTTKIPDAEPEEQVIFALDRDGDDRLDLAFTATSCDATGKTTRNYEFFCVRAWRNDESRFTNLASLIMPLDCLR